MPEDVVRKHTGIPAEALGELLGLARGTDFTELHVRYGKTTVTVRRTPGQQFASTATEPMEIVVDAQPEHLVAVTSPLVGVFRANVQTGESVTAGKQIGAIVALGMPTSVVAPVNGEVDTILVDNGSPVEYGQTLMVLQRTSDT